MTWRPARALLCVAAVVAAVLRADLAAQTAAPPIRRGPRPNMQLMSEALGVRCAYCHAQKGTTEDLDYRSDANPKKQVARLMLAMTADINAAVSAATLKPPSEATAVQCVTCHRGLTDPRPLTDILMTLLEEGSVEAAVDRYRTLRQKYFGRDAYDFSEKVLLNVAGRIVERGPDAAISLIQLNLEFYPRSADSYVLLGVAHTRKLRDAEAMVAFEKALEIDPNHAVAQGNLYQLRQYLPKKQ